MLNGTVTNRYTQGLFLVASAHGVLDSVDQSLQTVASILDANAEFATLIEHPLISEEAKTKLVKDVLGAHLDPLVVRFLGILFARGRSAYITAIAKRYHTLAEEAKGEVTVHVETAMPFTDEALKDIERKLGTSLNKTAHAIVDVKPDLIAGYRVKVGNRVMDASVQGALEQFGHRLLDNGAIKEGTL